VPRVSCAEYGVLQVDAPWARADSRFALMIEGLVLLLAQQMSVSAWARLLRTADQRLWRVIEHYVMAAHRDKEWSKVRRILVDESSGRRCRRCVAKLIDAEGADLLMIAEDRGSEALGELAAAMAEHRAKPEHITEIVMDMSPPYVAGAIEYCPGARAVFGAFHIMSRPQGDRQPKAARRVRRSRINMAS